MNAAVPTSWYRAHRTGFLLAIICAGTVTVLVLRRPDQWSAPAIWIEEGTRALPDFVANGWSSLFHPMMGYLVLPTKIILATSATLSFRWLPEIEYALTLAFTAGVLAAVAFSPTELKWRAVCALALLALPTDSEAFATSAYAFWWGSLLVALPLLWRREGRQYPVLRSGLLIVGGLSSPLVIALSPLYALRAAIVRSRAAFSDLVLAGATAALQARFLAQTTQTANTAYSSITPTVFVRKFFGYFLDVPVPFGAHDAVTLMIGAVFLLVLIVCSLRWRRELGPAYFFLLAAFLIAAVASVARVPIASIHPAFAGPRYFFLPFAFLSWAVAQLAALDAKLPRTVALIVATLVVRNALDVGQRRHDPLDWRGAVEHCLAADAYDLPVHWDGRAAFAWKVRLTGADCRRLVGQSLFDNRLGPAGGTP
jgi:hypothetical protein